MRTWISALVVACLAPFSISAGVIVAASSQGTANDPAEFTEWSVVNSWDAGTLVGTNYDTVSLYRPGYTANYYENNGYENVWDTLPGTVWISFANTVCPYCMPTDPSPAVLPDDPTRVYYNPAAGEYVSFYVRFSLDPALMPIGGVLNILADDSVSVYVNQTQVATFTQSDTEPFNYRLSNGSGLTVGYPTLASNLVPGENVLRFDVTNFGVLDQGANLDGSGGVWSFGLSYALTLDVPEVPEPGTLGLIGLGAVGLFILRRRTAKP